MHGPESLSTPKFGSTAKKSGDKKSNRNNISDDEQSNRENVPQSGKNIPYTVGRTYMD